MLEAKEKLRKQKKKIQSLKETMGVALSGSEGEAEEEEVFQKVFNKGVEEEEEEEKEESKEEKKEAARKPKPLETRKRNRQAAKETTPITDISVHAWSISQAQFRMSHTVRSVGQPRLKPSGLSGRSKSPSRLVIDK